jgi:hypothetical protein
MTYRGTARGGVIVLPRGTGLPEGTDVTIVPDPESRQPGEKPAAPSIWDRLTALGREVESQPCDLPEEDLAENHDHSLHGRSGKR